jgi:hypothetical protein
LHGMMGGKFNQRRREITTWSLWLMLYVYINGKVCCAFQVSYDNAFSVVKRPVLYTQLNSSYAFDRGILLIFFSIWSFANHLGLTCTHCTVWRKLHTEIWLRLIYQYMESVTWGDAERGGVLSIPYPKWPPLPYIVRYFWPGPKWLWSKVVHYIRDRVPFGTQPLRECMGTERYDVFVRDGNQASDLSGF